MKTLVKALNRFIIVSYDGIKNIAGAVMVAIILIVSVGIVSRYALSYSISWIEEICCLLLVWLCYLSASLTTVAKEHVVADFISGSLPSNLQKVLRSIIRLGEIAFFAVVTYSVIRLLPKLTNVSAALKMPRYVYYLPVLIFGAYMAFAVIVDMLNDLVPGFDYFGQRREEQERLRLEQEKRENEAMLKRVDAFMGIPEEEGKEESV
ncbi:MAG: TRAP transporter small permease [Lachnospiraceae bacterium]|nr:TRAP transporter small permease [Lachnospiraceae bacterium]MDO5550842.1 TRAP transporter small permease [Lachnospiraceae bacterium]